jgi:type I restriction enzyme S subunit
MANEWRTGKLGELVAFKTGKLDSNAAVPEGDYPFFTCSQETLRTNTFSFDTECVLLAGNNANGIYPLKYFHGKFDAYQRTYVVKPRDTEVLTTKFLYYALRPKLSELRSFSTGAATKFLTLTILNETEIQVPPLPVQQRIAGILSAYDDLIENCQRRIRLLETMARTLYREWFVHFRFPGHEKLPRVASPVGDIPQGWAVKPLESLMVAHIGGGWGKETADEDHTEPAWVIRGTDIPDARGSRVADVPHRFHTVSNLRTRRLQAGDILFEVSGGSKGQPVGRALLVTSQLLSALGDESVICASFCKRVRPDVAGYGSELLYLSFVEGYESGEIEQFQVQSTGISNFKWTEYIAKTERVIPPAPIRSCFRERVAPMFSQIATLGLKIQNLRRTRDLLLPRLLSGQTGLDGSSEIGQVLGAEQSA